MNSMMVASELREPVRCLPSLPLGNARGWCMICALVGLAPPAELEGITLQVLCEFTPSHLSADTRRSPRRCYGFIAVTTIIS